MLFKYICKDGTPTGKSFWGTPGGAVDEGETFEAAALRGLYEETGISVTGLDRHLAERRFVLHLPTGEIVLAHEKYFVLQSNNPTITCDNRTNEDRREIAKSKWWRIAELRVTTETVFPEHLVDILAEVIGSGC